MIICIGESLIDFVPVEETDSLPLYRPVAGGSPYNCAIAAARLEGNVAFAGTVSRDFFGDQIVERLQANGVSLSMIARVDRPTTLAFVKKESGGAARYAFFTNGAADRALSLDEIPQPLPQEALLQMGSISLIADPEGSTILELAEREHGRRVIVFDPNIRESLIVDEADYRSRLERAIQVATVLKTSDEDLSWIYPELSTKEAAARARAAGVRLVVVTQGAKGSTAYTAGGELFVPADEVEVSDTIGAGDSFMAALLVRLDELGATTPDAVASLDEVALRDLLTFAARISAVTCTRVGADPPYRSEVSV